MQHEILSFIIDDLKKLKGTI